MLKRMTHFIDYLYKVELVKPENHHLENVSVGVFLLQNAKLRKLELCYNSFKTFNDVDRLKDPALDTDYLCFALSEKNSEEFFF